MSLLVTQVGKVKNYVNGAWVASSSGQEEEVYNPATGEVIAYVPLSSKEELGRAVDAAAVAFQLWKRVAVPRRARYFFQYQQLLVEHWHELAELITLENGKSLEEAQGRCSAVLSVWNLPQASPH